MLNWQKMEDLETLDDREYVNFNVNHIYYLNYCMNQIPVTEMDEETKNVAGLIFTLNNDIQILTKYGFIANLTLYIPVLASEARSICDWLIASGRRIPQNLIEGETKFAYDMNALRQKAYNDEITAEEKAILEKDFNYRLRYGYFN